MRETRDIRQSPNVHIAVENFGPIEKAGIDLRPLTVFVGESNTGKTYLSTFIYALYQSFEGFSRFPWSYRARSYLNFTYRSRNRSPGAPDELGEEILETLEKLNTPERSFKFSDLPKKMRDRLESSLKKAGTFEDELQRCFDLESISELIRFTGGSRNELRISLKVYEEDQLLWSFNLKNDSDSNSTVDGFINKDLVLRPGNREGLEEILDLEDLMRLFRVSRWEAPQLYYLPAARSGIVQSRGVIASSLIDRVTNRIGLENLPEVPAFSGVIADFLKQIINYRKHSRDSGRILEIAEALETNVLRGEIRVSEPAAGFPEFRYHPQREEQSLPMSRSSSMVSELAPLVLFLRGVVQYGDTLIIEEPEAHLHPAAQTKVASTLARLVRVGVRVIVTTHSNWLLEQISNLVREGEVMRRDESQSEQVPWLTNEEVGAWLFRTDKPVQEIMFEDIAGIEPEEYGEVAEELYNRSVDLRTQLEETGGGTEVEQE